MGERVRRIEPRGLRRDDAAAYVGVSASKFDELVSDGRMPQAFRLDACVIWDRNALDRAIDDLSSGPQVVKWTKRAG